jgi:hypothetical protein
LLIVVLTVVVNGTSSFAVAMALSNPFSVFGFAFIINFTSNYGRFGLFVFKIGRDTVTAIFTYIVIGNLIQIRGPKPRFRVYEQNANNLDL